MQVDVFVNDNGQPQHLAVLDEQKTFTSGEMHHRPVCGSNPGTMKVGKAETKEMKLDCKDCEAQVDLLNDLD